MIVFLRWIGMQFCINGIKEVAQGPVFHGAHSIHTTPSLPSLPDTSDQRQEPRHP